MQRQGKPDVQLYRQEEEKDTKPEKDRGFTVTHSHVMHPKEAVMKVCHCSNWKGNEMIQFPSSKTLKNLLSSLGNYWLL